MNTRSKYFCVLWKDKEPFQLHIFYLEPESQWSTYRAGISLHYYAKRESEGLYNADRKLIPYAKYRGRVQSQYDWDNDREIERRLEAKFGDLPLNLPTFEHDSVWDFYKAIGYDYKAKRYVRAD